MSILPAIFLLISVLLAIYVVYRIAREKEFDLQDAIGLLGVAVAVTIALAAGNQTEPRPTITPSGQVNSTVESFTGDDPNGPTPVVSTLTQTEISTDTPEPTLTPTLTEIATDTPEPTLTPTPTEIPTDTPEPTLTPTAVPVPPPAIPAPTHLISPASEGHVGTWVGRTEQGQPITFQVGRNVGGEGAYDLTFVVTFEDSQCTLGVITFNSQDTAHVFEDLTSSFLFPNLVTNNASASVKGTFTSDASARGTLEIVDKRGNIERLSNSCPFITTLNWDANKQ